MTEGEGGGSSGVAQTLGLHGRCELLLFQGAVLQRGHQLLCFLGNRGVGWGSERGVDAGVGVQPGKGRHSLYPRKPRTPTPAAGASSLLHPPDLLAGPGVRSPQDLAGYPSCHLLGKVNKRAWNGVKWGGEGDRMGLLPITPQPPIPIPKHTPLQGHWPCTNLQPPQALSPQHLPHLHLFPRVGPRGSRRTGSWPSQAKDVGLPPSRL